MAKEGLMKLISFLIAYLFFFNSAIAGLPPTSLKGQAGTKSTTFNFEVPNKTATKTSTGGLVETGNKNILENPSFEHSTANTGWTLTSGSFVSDNTPIEGLKNGQLTLSAQSLFFSQDSTLYASQFADGVQGLAYIRVRTSITSTPIYVCPRQAGNTASTSQCVTVNPDGKWGFYKIPFILGGTSNGIAVTSDGVAITGNVEVDDAFVGAQDVKQDISVIGPWQSYTPTFTNLGTVSSLNARWRQVGQSIELQIKATTGTVTASEQRISLPNSYTVSSSIVSPQTVGRVGRPISSATYFGTSVIVQPNNGYINFGTQSSAANENTVNTGASFGNTETFSLYATVPVNELQGSSSVYSSTNADTDWASCGHTTSDFIGFGTVTNIETQCKREGDDLLMRGKFTAGTTTAVEGRVALKLNGVSLTSAGTGKIPSIQISQGNGARSSNNAQSLYSVLMEPSVSYITFGLPGASSSGLTKLNGSSIIANSETLSFSARIPISGWDNSNVIIGTFNEVVTTPGVSKPKTCSFKFGGASRMTSCSASPCTIYDLVGDCTSSVTRSATGLYDVNFPANYWNGTSYNCNAKVMTWASGTAPITYNNTTDTNTVKSLRLFNTANVDGALEIFCHGAAP